MGPSGVGEEKAEGDGEMNKEQDDKVLRNLFLTYASVSYASVEDDFVSAAKAMAKKKYGIDLTHELENLMAAAYKIGFADAVSIGVNSYED